jgi:hypothetical protein
VDACALVTVRRLDAAGNLTTLPANLTGTLSASGITTDLRLGTTCTPAPSSAATTATLSFGSAISTSFAFLPRTAGMLSFTATATGITTAATGSTTVNPGALASVRFVSPPTVPQTAGACVPLTLEALDVGGNRVSSAVMNVALASTATGTFHSTNACAASSITSTTIPANATATVYFKPTAVMAHTVSATPPGPASAASATFTVTPGSATTLGRTPAFAAGTAADSCVSFTLTRSDALGNPTSSGALPVVVTLSGSASQGPQGALVFPSSGSCGGSSFPASATVTIPDMASSTVFSVKARAAGSLTMNLTSALSTNPVDTTTTVSAGPLSSLAFTTTPPASVQVGSCTAVTLEGRDQYGNPTSLTSNITLSRMPVGTATFHLSADCSGLANDTINAPMTPTVTFRVRPTLSGMGVQLSATSSGATTSQLWNFTPVPEAVRFKSPPPSVTRLACSGPFVVELLSGGAVVPSGQARSVTFTTTSGTAVQWFSDSQCTMPSPTAALTATDTETPGRYLVATDTAPVTVKAEAPSLAPDFATFTPSGNPGAMGLTITSTSPELEFRSCLPVTVTRTLAGVPFSGTFGTTVTLGKAGVGLTGLAMYAGSICNGPEVSSATIPAGQNAVTISVLGRSAERVGTGPAFSVATATLTATDSASGGFGATTPQSFNVHPAVRRGSCSIASGSTTTVAGAPNVPCTIYPALPAGARTRSFFTFQAVVENAPDTPSSAAVNCALNGAATDLVCARAGTSQTARIEWQLVSMGGGHLQVAHFDDVVTTDPVGTNFAVDISSAGLTSTSGAFLLFGLRETGVSYRYNDTISAELTSPTTVTLRQQDTANRWPVTFGYSLQVVQLSGATVTRGSTAGTGSTVTATVVSPPPTTASVLLHSHRVAYPMSMPTNENAICKYRLRGTLTSDTQLTFTRGAGSLDPDCTNVAVEAVAFERLSLPTSLVTIQSLPPVTINGNTTTSAAQTITGPLDRTWSFLSGQGTGGQSGGETNYESGDRVGYSQARITTPGATTLTLIRGGIGSGINSTFGLFAVTFNP